MMPVSTAAAAFGQRLRELRRSRDLSQRELAERMHTGASQITEIETGVQNVRLDTIARLAEALGIQPRELFGPDPDALTLEHVALLLRTALDVIQSDRENNKEIMDAGTLRRIAHAIAEQTEPSTYSPKPQTGRED
jgi:DNA-binding Xre family transcriptional regulator